MSGDWETRAPKDKAASAEDEFSIFDPVDDGGFAPIPPGQYDLIVESAVVKDTKAGTGRLIALQLQIAGGEEDGRRVWHNFNVDNVNATATNIGIRDLASFFTAINERPSYGREWENYAADMVNKRVRAVIGVGKDDRREVKRWLKG